jgi:NADPH:quinone reductase-like Zn-dependent oxidoreductase
MLPFTPGQVVIGTIEALGKEVKLPFEIGDRVIGFVKQGGNARFVSAEVDNLIKASPNIKNSEAACLVEDWMTAYRALRIAKNAFQGAAMFGMNVFITDGFSPVGQAVIQLADLEGANIFCCANKCHHGYLQSVSSRTHCFAPQIEDWLPDVMEKMDIVIDNTCIDGYASSWQALSDKGILICLATVNMGYSTRACGILDIEDMLRKFSAMKAKYTMSQTVFFDIRQDFEQNRTDFSRDLMYLMFLVEQGKIHPKVGEKVALDDVGDAHELLANGKNNGTIVCLPWKKC